MSSPAQIMESIHAEALLPRTADLKKEGWRFVAISAARLPGCIELLYSFDCDYRLLSLRLELPLEGPRVPSVSSIYWCAFLYENEIHDLFGVEVEGMAVDFKGEFYQTAVKYPFGSVRPPQPPATATATTPSRGQPAPSTATATTARS
jgi:ech hydrogenase subunit D